MNGRDENHELDGYLTTRASLLTQTIEKISSFLEHDIPQVGRDWKSALVVAGLLENYYTSAETALFRIAQQTGIQINADRWQADLLARLSHAVEDVRPRVLGESTYKRLDELRRFHHFKRYYFETDYDWDKLDFLLKNLNELHPLLMHDIASFQSFLRVLRKPGDE